MEVYSRRPRKCSLPGILRLQGGERDRKIRTDMRWVALWARAQGNCKNNVGLCVRVLRAVAGASAAKSHALQQSTSVFNYCIQAHVPMTTTINKHTNKQTNDCKRIKTKHVVFACIDEKSAIFYMASQNMVVERLVIDQTASRINTGTSHPAYFCVCWWWWWVGGLE